MSKKLTLLFAPLSLVGHVNASVGVAQRLLDRGHRIIFAVEKSFEGQLLRYGFEEAILTMDEDEQPGENIARLLFDAGVMGGLSPLENMKALMVTHKPMAEKKKYKIEPQMKVIVEKYNPDIILIDDVTGAPSLI